MLKTGPFFSVPFLQRIVSDNRFCTRGSKHGIVTKENPGGLKKYTLKKVTVCQQIL